MSRNTISVDELQAGEFLRFIYDNPFGRLMLRIMKSVWVSKVVGAYMNTPLSKTMIPSFIRKNNIDMTPFEKESYRCFNDFFTRRIRPSARPMGNGLVSPCDAKLTAYKINEQSVFYIKNSEYSLFDLLCDQTLADEYKQGVCLIFRLSVDDYHRYCYFDDCVEAQSRFIKGELHTVQPIAIRDHKVFCRNSREYTVLETQHFGKAVQMEVGAMCVGKIQNHHGQGMHHRGEEKGMFLFGGSTVILLLKDVSIDEEIMQNTARRLETVVKMGESIGVHQ